MVERRRLQLNSHNNTLVFNDRKNVKHLVGMFHNGCKLPKSTEVDLFFVSMGSMLQGNKGQKHGEKDIERDRNKEERTVIHKNLPAVCLTAYSQVINTLKAFCFF